MQQARPKLLACNQIAQLAVNLMFLLLQNVSVLEVPTRVSISFAMEIYPSTSPSMCERERETLLPHQIPYLSQSVFVVQVNKKPDHKEKEKHRRWDSEIFFFPAMPNENNGYDSNISSHFIALVYRTLQLHFFFKH